MYFITACERENAKEAEILVESHFQVGKRFAKHCGF